EREAVRVKAARRQPQDRVARLDPAAGHELAPLADADAEAGDVEVLRLHHPGVLGGLAAQEDAAGPPAALGDALDQLGHESGVDATAGDVVEEERRPAAARWYVVNGHHVRCYHTS